MNRVQNALVVAAAWIAGGAWATWAGAAEAVKVQVDPGVKLRQIAPEFIGFGYETSAVAQTNYFSPANSSLVQLYRNLGPHGLIRIGGNVSDHTRYEPDGVSTPHTEREVTVINRARLADLAGFARATGWRVMWGLNLGTGSPEAAAQEAVAVAQALGDRLQSFEIGNEVDLQGAYQFKFANFESYYSNYLAFKATIRTAWPAAVFSGPDVAGNLAWLRAFAQHARPEVELLTYHYYRTGAQTAGATIENLLRPDEGWRDRLGGLESVSRESGVPFRINEINSFYGGGKAGVSDTFGSALWCLNNMFVLATFGCDGVNMETDVNQLGFISHYSPVVHDAAMSCQARPEYYGMLAFALAGRGDLIQCHRDQAEFNLNVYATRDGHGSVWITAINEEVARDAALEVAMPSGYSKAQVFRMTAPSVTSTNKVSLAGAEVTPDGRWTPGMPEPVPVEAGTANVAAPHASAVLLHLQN